MDGGFSLAKAADWLWTVVVAAVAMIWRMMNRRIDVMSGRIKAVEEGKADRAEVDRQRGHVEKIYGKLEEQGRLLTKIDTTLELMRRGDK